MSHREPKYSQKTDAPDKYSVRRSFLDNFTPAFIGLGNLTRQKETFEGLAVILDLQGFTAFCDQRDPQHEVPRFLDRFLKWLFQRIREELFDSEDGDDVVLWSHLPIFGKFLGDGILLIWDATDISLEARGNIVQAFDIIVSDHLDVFLEKNAEEFTRPPLMLRCGIAQGQVTSIANGNDVYVFRSEFNNLGSEDQRKLIPRRRPVTSRRKVS